MQSESSAAINRLSGLETSERDGQFRLILDSIPGFVCALSANGEIELVNRQTLEYFGKTLEELRNWASSDAVHPDDLPRVVEAWKHAVETGQPYDLELRQRRSDGVYRWFQSRALPAMDTDGRITRWYMLLTDIHDRKIAEAAVRASEQEFRQIIDTIPGFVWTMNAAGEVELVNQQMLDYFGGTVDELKDWARFLHSDDRDRVIAQWQRTVKSGEPYDVEHRLRRADGVYRWFQARGLPQRDDDGRIVRWYNLLTDIDEGKRAEEALRSNEQSLRLIIDSIPGFVATMNAAGEVELVNRQTIEYFGKTIEELKNWETSDAVHPDDRPLIVEAWRRAVETGQPIVFDHRSRRADGVYRWCQLRGYPQRDAEGRIIRWYNLVTDIDDRKKAEEKVQRSEACLSEAQHLSHTGSFACKVSSGEMFWSEETFRIFEYDRNTKPSVEAVLQRVHPEDKAVVQAQIDRATNDRSDCDLEYRLLLPDGSVKRVHVMAHALQDEPDGFDFVGAVMDVTEQWQARTDLEKAFEEIKRLKDRLHEENVALREQIDQAFMFEEIVGSSSALKIVLSSIVSVAPTDSTVLITGETGTGKELIARAIHKHSQRAGQPFISVNCASIPPALIASELFGHEKGAFTGAVQRRQGRFELAHSGTIFLDEIGELPAETQVALLRVLQERHFERVGGSRVIHTDVRIIAATNRDLAAAIDLGTFRSDLFYRLNVFPIAVPPLRQRKEDIPMLLEYFVKRYADKARKQIRKIDKNTLKLCQSYHWPGNIRELQNIVERSVILCSTGTFRVEPAWFSNHGAPRRLESGALTKSLQSYEKEIIEAALTETKGKVAGPNGAASRLGIPRSTLDARIKQLNIKKYRFR